jgi:hypothetical protein
MAQRVEIVLSGEERELFERWGAAPEDLAALALRSRIVLTAARGAAEH